MAKVNIKFDDKAFSARVEQTFQKVKRSKQMQTQIGEFLVKRIRAEAKRGKPLNKTRSFPKLKESSVKNRERLSKLNPTTKPFRPNFSNTSLTGQLLDSISHTPTKDFVVIAPSGRRHPYVINNQGGFEKLKRGVNATNKDLAKTLAKIDFIIFDSETIKNEDKILKRIRSIVIKFLRRALKVEQLR